MSTPQDQLPIPQTPTQPAEMTLRDYIDTAGDKIGVPKSLRDSIFQNETGFEHYDGAGRVKRSPKGARGIGQLMPATARTLGVDPDDPIQNAYGSLKLQKQLYDKYLTAQGDPHQAAILTAAAYNSGEGNVDKYGGVPPFAETQGYVKKVAAHLRQHPIIIQTPPPAALVTSEVKPRSLATSTPDPLIQEPASSPLPRDRTNRKSQMMMLPGRGYQEIPYDPNHPDEGPTQATRRLEMNAINQGTQGDLLQHAAAIRDEFGDPTGAQMPVSAATKTPLYGQGYGAEYTKSPLDPGYGDAPAAQPNDMEFGGMSPAEKAAMATAQAQPNAIDNFSRIAMAKMAEQRRLAARRAQLQAKAAQARAVMAKKQGQGTIGEGLNTPSPDAMGSGLSSTPVGGNLRQLDDPEAARIIRLQNQVASEQSPDEKATGMAPGTSNARLFDPKLTVNEEALRRAAIEKGQEQQQAEMQRLAPQVRAEIAARQYATKNGYLRILDQLANRSLSEVSQVLANAPELVPSLKIAETLGPKGFTDAIQGAQSYLRDYSKVQAAASNYEPPNVTGGQQATKVLANMGFDVAKLTAAVAITKLPLSSVMVGESIAMNADKPAQEQIEAASKAYIIGRALEVLPEAAQKGLAKVPGIGKIVEAHPEAAARTIAGVGFGVMSGTGEALAGGTKAQIVGATLGGGLTGAVLAGGGPKEIARGAVEYTIQSPLTPEPVKDFMGDVMRYGKGLVKSEDGRNLSLYVDKETGKVFGNELTADEAKNYDPSIITGEKRPVRNAKTVSGDEYDQLARALNIETKTPAKQIEAGPQVESVTEKNITPEKPNEAQINRVSNQEPTAARVGAADVPTRVSVSQVGQSSSSASEPGSVSELPEPVRHVDLQVRDEEGKFDKETAAQAEARRQQVTQSVSTPQNPLVITDGQLPDGRRLSDIHRPGITKDTATRFRKEIIKQGYDGVVFKDENGDAQVAVFDPSKITISKPQQTRNEAVSTPLGGVEPQTQPVEAAKAETSPAIQQAFQDWHERRAYIDGNGNYHVKGERKSGGPIAPWNKEVKRTFANVSEFHKAVEAHFTASSVARPTDVPLQTNEGQVSADSEGAKQRSLPKTFEAAQMETGKNLHYTPESIKDDGVTLGKQLVADKGVDGAIEFVKTGDGIEWASTGYEVLSKLRQEEADLRQSYPKAADLVQEKRLKFLDDFVEGATERGRSIVGIKAIEEFAPDRAVYLLNKASQKKRGRGISAEEDARMAALGQELERERDRSKNLEAALAEATVKAIKRSGKTAKPTKITYRSKLDQQGEIAKASLAAKLGSLSFGNLTVPRSQSGKVQVGTPELPGDAELLAQYAASRLDKLNAVADLNAEMVKEFGAEVEPHLPIIRQRAYQIRHEARLSELEAKDTEVPRRRTILQEIQKEITAARQIVQGQARQAEAANKTAKVEAAKEQKAQARQEAKTAREQERSKREAIAKDARQRLKDAKREYQEATKAETQGYRETIKAGREAARVAKLWDTPIRNEAQSARGRVSTNDPKSPATMEDLVSIAAEKMLPKTPGGMVRKGVISPVQLYSEMRNEFPSLITKKNKGEIYKRAYQRIEDMTSAAREAARLRSASAEAQKVWTEQGMDINAQGILIQKAEVTRRQTEIRKQMVAEFNRVSRGRVKTILHEIENVPRAMQTTLNMHQGRQGLYAILTHPIAVTAKVGIPATLKGYSAFTREQYIQRVRELQEHPYYKLGEKAGLNLAELPGTIADTKLAVEEDELQSTVAMNLPHVRLSNQGFALGMNSERVQLFAVYAAIGEAEGYTWESNPSFFKEVAEIANDATGRGTMPKAIQGMARLTNHVFYATRLNVSRVKLLNDLFNPWQYHNYDPVTRKIMAKEAIKILLALGAIFYAAHRLGLHVEHDPNKPDTGKVVWGHTHYDLTGGIGTDVRFAYRMVRGIAKELVGQKLPENEKPLALGIRFGRQKLAPWPGAVWDYLEGKNAVGEPANLKVDTHEKAKTLKENILLRMLVPIVADDFANGFVDGGWLGMAKESPVVIGFGAQTYPPRHEKPEALTPKEPTVPVAVKDKVDKEFKRLDIKTGTVQGSIDVLTELEQKDAVRKIMESEKVDRKAATELLREKNLLPQDELDKFNQSYQENLYRLANQLITNDQFYSRLKDFEKEDRLDRVKKIAHTIARREIKTELKTK